MSLGFAISLSVLAVGLADAAIVQAQSGPQSAADGPATEDTTSGLADIVVTAQRRSENLQDVPIAITALSSQTLAKAGVTDVQSLQVAVPGLSFAQATAYSLPRIRGVGTGATGPGVENSVAMYVDGVYIASTSSGLLSFNNIYQIAVLKGPQGTLFGRNATGGVIQITTFDPGRNARLDASLTIGNLATIGGKLYASTPLGPDLAADIAVYYRDQRDGFGRNLTTGREVGKDREIALRSKFKWDPGETTVVRVAGDYSKATGVRPLSQTVRGTLPISRVPFMGGKFDTVATFDPSQRIEQGGGSLQINQDVGALSVVSISAYRNDSVFFNFDADAQAVPLTNVSSDQHNRQFTQELQLISPKSGRLTWMLGAYYFDSANRFTPQQVRAVAPPFLAPPTVITTFTRQTSKSVAGFSQATLELGEATRATAGLRYTTEKREIALRKSVVLPNGFAPLPTAGAAANRFNKLTWRLSVDHRLSDQLLGYASYNRGFKSGLFDPLSVPPVLVAPETLDAYEIGVKTELFDRRVRLNASAFHYDYKNVQILRITNGVPQLLSGPAAKIDGIDLDATARISDRLEVNAGLSVLRDRFTLYPNAIFTTPLPMGGNVLSTSSAKGNRLPMTPDWTANVSATYTVPTRLGELALNGTYLHNDGYFEGPENRVRQHPFDVVNGSLTMLSGRFEASVWAKNLFNEFYGVQFSAQATYDGVLPAAGRTFGLTVGIKM